MTRSLRRILTGLVMLLAGVAAHAAKKVEPAGSWIADFRRYAAQKDLGAESSYSRRPAQPGALAMSDLLRALPAPAGWPQLHLNLTAAVAQAPAGVEKQRLQAGVWLLDYLQGDRATILAELPPASPLILPMSPVAQAVNELRSSLGEKVYWEDKPSPEDEVAIFETRLEALEPIDLEAVKRALGGEENFARLQRLVGAGKAMNEKMAVVYGDYRQTKDKDAARKRLEELTREFTRQYGADRKALAPYMEKPLVERYYESFFREEAGPYEAVPSISIPDLVTIAGPEEAEFLLRRALHLPAMLELKQESGAETSRLARELARAEIVNLKVPQWALARAVDQSPLFDALLERFSVPDPNEAHFHEFQVASGYYLAGLIQDGRTADALAFASRSGGGVDLDLPAEVMDAFEHGGEATVLWEFLRDWLGKFPVSREWDRFNHLSVQLGRQDELKALIRKLAGNGTMAGLSRLRVQEMQADAELATDDLAAAVTRLQAAATSLADSPQERASQLALIEKLLELADLRADATGFTLGQAAAEAYLERTWAAVPGEALGGSIKLVTALNRLGHVADAYRIGRATIERVAAVNQKAGKDELHLPEFELPHLLGEQLRAAVELGRWPEALALVQENPSWNVRDASALLRERVRSNNQPVGLYLAQVVLQKDAKQARRILEAQLGATPGVDAVYAAYVALLKKDARPLLEKLAAADRYEERPLLWQARLLLDAGKWDAASAILQQAINVDPSDGEQGRGDRMRVYAFMAEAMKGKGDAAKAKFFEDVVRSIRLSETADRWFATGAYARAIALYRQALGFFQDAYCIQSRLAVRLADEGRVDEAAEHYRRAFELMPDSFGRVESHCFGCEHIFAGERTQGVAEQVFTTMLAARPDKPQLHYLMGYLRNQQERPAEAAPHFRRAVELDPLYLNAWDKLAELASKLTFTPAQQDDLQLKLLELDPGRHHVSPDLSHVSDLARLWRTMAAADLVLAALPASGPLWEFKASAARLAGKRDEAPRWEPPRRDRDFAAVLLDHEFVGALQNYLAGLNAPKEPEVEPPPAESEIPAL